MLKKVYRKNNRTYFIHKVLHFYHSFYCRFCFFIADSLLWGCFLWKSNKNSWKSWNGCCRCTTVHISFIKYCIFITLFIADSIFLLQIHSSEAIFYANPRRCWEIVETDVVFIQICFHILTFFHILAIFIWKINRILYILWITKSILFKIHSLSIFFMQWLQNFQLFHEPMYIMHTMPKTSFFPVLWKSGKSNCNFSQNIAKNRNLKKFFCAFCHVENSFFPFFSIHRKIFSKSPWQNPRNKL